MGIRATLSAQRPTAVRLIDGAIRGLGAVRDRMGAAPDGETAPAGYGDMWRPADEEGARRLIFNDPDPEVFERSGQADAERLAPLIEPTDTVLDLGCGIGRVVKYVAPMCGTIWAVDASETMLGYARSRLAGLPNVRFARCSGTSVPDVADDAVDVVYSLITLQHLEREDAFALLRDLRRVLRPGGRAYITFPNLLSDPYLDCFLTYVDQGEVANPVRARLYTPQEVARILPAAGFEVRELQEGTEIVAICGPPPG
jgi:ubiquinone/menaquinone biosynthesis C-methylase UbiE